MENPHFAKITIHHIAGAAPMAENPNPGSVTVIGVPARANTTGRDAITVRIDGTRRKFATLDPAGARALIDALIVAVAGLGNGIGPIPDPDAEGDPDATD